MDRAILEGETEGFVKIHVKAGTDTIVGATIVGTGAGNMISEISVAMQHGIGLGKLASVIHPYPTNGMVWSSHHHPNPIAGVSTRVRGVRVTVTVMVTGYVLSLRLF